MLIVSAWGPIVQCRRQERNAGSGFKWFLLIIFSSLFLVRVLQFAPSGRSCTVQCFWLGPNSEFLTNWMNEFLVDQNNHPSREHMTGENPEYFAIQMQYIRIAYRWINSKFHTPTPLNSIVHSMYPDPPPNSEMLIVYIVWSRISDLCIRWHTRWLVLPRTSRSCINVTDYRMLQLSPPSWPKPL